MKKEILKSLWKLAVIGALIGVLISFMYYSDKQNMLKMIECGIILLVILIIFATDEIKDVINKKELTAEDIERITKEEIEKIMKVKK